MPENTSSPPQKGRIFISYRRVDSAGYAGRIYDRLVANFGEDAIFMDVDTIEGGTDFVKVLEDAMQSCDVLVALIGKQWLDIKDTGGKRRLDNPEDFVRIEIATALKRNIRVIPVLVDGVDMPQPTDLPENLKALARRNALQVNHHSFNPDVYRLIGHTKSALDEAEELRVVKTQALQAAREKVAREIAERAAAEKAAQERAEREEAERIAKEKAEHEAAEKAAREKAEEEAAKEKAEREAAEKAVRKKPEHGVATQNAEHENARHKATEEKEHSKPEPTKEKGLVSGILPLKLKPQVIVALIVVIGTIAAILFSSFNSPNQTKNTSDPTSISPTLASNNVIQTPLVEQKKFKLAMVLISPHDDGGFSQAHYEGLQYVADNVPNVEVIYKENIPEGADSEKVFRDLANEGYSLILGTSFGYMDMMEKVASEFPTVVFLNISGTKTNGANFGNLYGAMEDMSYLAGMLAGARAKLDGNLQLGYMATFPVPEELRIGNAIALGMRKTCPECSMDVRWLNTWNNPAIEREAALSLFSDGAQIIFSGTSTSTVIDVAQEENKWGVTRDWHGSCNVKSCLTSTYWNWGEIYAKITNDVIAGTYKPGSDYFDADSGALGLYGLMGAQEMTDGMKDLPPEVIVEVRTILNQMLAGKFTRFDVFSGPIYDDKGNLIVPVGERLEQVDLDAFPEFDLNCKYCMKWWAEGITADLPY